MRFFPPKYTAENAKNAESKMFGITGNCAQVVPFQLNHFVNPIEKPTVPAMHVTVKALWKNFSLLFVFWFRIPNTPYFH